MNLMPQSGQDISASSPTSSPTLATIRLWTTASSARFGGDSGKARPAFLAHELAQVELAPLTVDRLGQMNRGLVLAPLTHHRPDHPAGSDPAVPGAFSAGRDTVVIAPVPARCP